MRYRYRPAVERNYGRVSLSLQPASLNLPRPSVCCDGEWTSVAFSYGNGNSDPVFSIDIDLSGTRVGRLVSEVVWRWRERGAAS